MLAQPGFIVRRAFREVQGDYSRQTAAVKQTGDDSPGRQSAAGDARMHIYPSPAPVSASRLTGIAWLAAHFLRRSSNFAMPRVERCWRTAVTVRPRRAASSSSGMVPSIARSASDQGGVQPLSMFGMPRLVRCTLIATSTGPGWRPRS